jgi:tRNA(His) 5'-end guanylyltransferase
MVQTHALAVYDSTGTGLWACNDPTEKATMQNARVIPTANLRNIKMYLMKETDNGFRNAIANLLFLTRSSD